jgi:hypothetical protein
VEPNDASHIMAAQAAIIKKICNLIFQAIVGFLFQ